MSGKNVKNAENTPPGADESVLKPGDEDPGGKKEKEKKEVQELQSEDPGNQGS